MSLVSTKSSTALTQNKQNKSLQENSLPLKPEIMTTCSKKFQGYIHGIFTSKTRGEKCKDWINNVSISFEKRG